MYLLLDDIKAAVIAAFGDTSFQEPRKNPTTPAKARVPLVRIGALPPKRKEGQDQGEDFPFVVIRSARGKISETDAAREDSVTVRFLCGVFADEDDPAGVIDLDVMMRRILRLLCERRLWGGNRWEREMPIQWETGLREQESAHPWPYYVGWIEATFSAAGVLETDNAEALGGM